MQDIAEQGKPKNYRISNIAYSAAV